MRRGRSSRGRGRRGRIRRIVVHPVHQALREGPDPGAEEERQRDVPVERAPDELAAERSDDHPAGYALRLDRADPGRHDCRHRRGGDRLLGGDIDVLTASRRATRVQRDERRGGGLARRVMPGLRHGDPHRLLAGVAGQNQRAARGHQNQVGRLIRRLRPVLPEPADRDVDQVLVQRAQVLEAQPA